MPGPPYAFGAVLVILAILVSILIPDNPHASIAVHQQQGSTVAGSGGIHYAKLGKKSVSFVTFSFNDGGYTLLIIFRFFSKIFNRWSGQFL